MRVLVVGATGKYAGLVVPELKAKGVVVRALVRDQKTADLARQQGADEVARGDLQEPESLRMAAAGVNGVFHINPAFAPDEATLGVSMVEAARRAGVSKFVFSGVIHPSIIRMGNHSAKQPVEAAMYESGMTFTVLQPAMFMQTILNGWKEVVQRGRFSLPFSRRAKVCYVDYRDVAEAAATALTSDTLDNGTFELSAAGLVDRFDLTELMSAALGRTVEAGEPSFDEWARMANLPEGPVRDGMRRMYADYDRYGFPGGNAVVLRTILGREPRTLTSFFEEQARREQVAA